MAVRVLVHRGPPAAAPLAADEVGVWAVPLDRPPHPADVLAADLTADERDRAARYRAPVVRHQFLVGRGLLRRLLGEYLGVPPGDVPIGYLPGGKPVLPGNELHFNLTHTADLAVLAVARRRVGVDVERVRPVPDRDSLVGRFFSPAERDAYHRLPADLRQEAFFRAWTCKEAVIKAAGGSVQLLDTFDVELDPSRPPAVLAARHPLLATEGWAVGAWEPTQGFVAAVAVEGAGPVSLGERGA